MPNAGGRRRSRPRKRPVCRQGDRRRSGAQTRDRGRRKTGPRCRAGRRAEHGRRIMTAKDAADRRHSAPCSRVADAQRAIEFDRDAEMQVTIEAVTCRPTEDNKAGDGRRQDHGCGGQEVHGLRRLATKAASYEATVYSNIGDPTPGMPRQFSVGTVDGTRTAPSNFEVTIGETTRPTTALSEDKKTRSPTTTDGKARGIPVVDTPVASNQSAGVKSFKLPDNNIALHDLWQLSRGGRHLLG